MPEISTVVQQPLGMTGAGTIPKQTIPSSIVIAIQKITGNQKSSSAFAIATSTNQEPKVPVGRHKRSQ